MRGLSEIMGRNKGILLEINKSIRVKFTGFNNWIKGNYFGIASELR